MNLKLISGSLVKLLLYTYLSITIIVFPFILLFVFIFGLENLFIFFTPLFPGLLFSLAYLIYFLCLPYKFSKLYMDQNSNIYNNQNRLYLKKIIKIYQKTKITGKIEIPILIIEYEDLNIYLLEDISLFFLFRYGILYRKMYKLAEKIVKCGLNKNKIVTEFEQKLHEINNVKCDD